jgi:hypothetical protein
MRRRRALVRLQSKVSASVTESDSARAQDSERVKVSAWATKHL